ncbi:MAG: hypothetical protein ACREGC_03550, partial [Minisyncoccia bacterium]
FREALEAALRESNIRITHSAQVYVVNLLKEFSRSEVAFAGTDYGEKVIMADLYQRATKADGQEALQIYRHLGDSSLYLLGFFEESGAQRIVSDSYYRDMGAQAYFQTSCLSRSHTTNGAALFMELSERFTDLVKVIVIISKYGNIKAQL